LKKDSEFGISSQNVTINKKKVLDHITVRPYDRSVQNTVCNENSIQPFSRNSENNLVDQSGGKGNRYSDSPILQRQFTSRIASWYPKNLDMN